MMAGIVYYADLLKQSGVEDSGDEYMVNRTFTVSGLGLLPASDIQPAALQALGLPRMGDAHPQLPFAFCSKRVVNPLPDVTAVEVVCTYRWPKGIGNAQTRVEFGSSLRQIRSRYTYSGQPIKVKYQYVDALGNPFLKWGAGEVNKYIPMRNIRFTLFTRGSPGSLIQATVGCVNDDDWEGGKAMTWLVTGAQSNIILYGDSLATSMYQTTWTLECNPDTWNEIVYYRDATGHIPWDIIDNQPDLPEVLDQVDPSFSQRWFNGFTVPISYRPIDFTQAFPF